MPIVVPSLDDRSYDDLLQETISRIPVHTPEWTNFNRSDPGVTLIELFAFLTETMLYRANRIPERNRLAFLSMLGIPLRPASPARGIVTIDAQKAGLAPRTLSTGFEVLAGDVPFRAVTGVEALPVESRVYVKRPVTMTPDLEARYRQLYASFLVDGLPGEPPPGLQPYETRPVDGRDPNGVDLVADTVDGCLWVALVAKPGDDLVDLGAKIAGRVLNLGVVPVVTDVERALPPAGVDAPGRPAAGSHLEYALPRVGSVDPSGA